MGFEKNGGVLRKIGRSVVLPAESIKEKVYKELFSQHKDIRKAIDVGSGTFFWTEWLVLYVKNIIAVDVIYTDKEVERGLKNKAVSLSNNLSKTLEMEQDANTLVWLSDVLHHIQEDRLEKFLEKCMKRYDYIVIKDINQHHKFGNFMNKLHDRVINGEKVHNVDPDILLSKLKTYGYKISFWELPRLWYPHFLIIARKI